eukprot:GHVU01168622.1.p1 GENE.GHVU01168622.1~~GHVU01168622.1.p1  ORF type:complete len:136 (-),score=14.17 GHVU01168622.1:571-978(-)
MSVLLYYYHHHRISSRIPPWLQDVLAISSNLCDASGSVTIPGFYDNVDTQVGSHSSSSSSTATHTATHTAMHSAIHTATHTAMHSAMHLLDALTSSRQPAGPSSVALARVASESARLEWLRSPAHHQCRHPPSTG